MSEARDETAGDPDSSPLTVDPNIVLAVLVSGAFVVILNQTLLNTALPAFMGDFGITANSAQWVTTVFMLVNGIMIPVTAYLIQRFSTRSLYFAAMGLFTAGTVLCALAPVYPMLLLGRVVQAAGGGIILPLMQTILFAVFPRDRRGRAMGMFGLVISFAPAIGPSLSGWIVDHLPWQVLFWMMVPIAVLVMAVAWFILKNISESRPHHLDVLSVVLSTLAFGGMLFGFGNAGNTGWSSPEVLVPLIIGGITLVLFIHRQLTLPDPVLELRVLRHVTFTLGTVLGMLVFVAMIGGMMMIPLYVQNMTDHSAMQSGLVLLPGAIVMGLMSPVTGRAFDRYGARWLCVIGFALVAVSTVPLSMLRADTSLLLIAAANAVRMLGTAMVIMPVTTAALNHLPSSLIPHGTAVNNTLRQIAASVGTAVLITVMTASALDPATHGAQGPIHGVNVAFLVSGAVALLGMVGGFFLVGTRPMPEAARTGRS